MSSFLITLGSFIVGNGSSQPTTPTTTTPPPTTPPPPEKKEELKVELDQIPPDEVLVERDCNTCPEQDCEEHQQYPSYLDFDTSSPLLGSMSPYGRHLMISTAQCDWPERIEEEKGTLAANLQALLVAQPMPWRTFITNTSMIATHATTVRCGLDVVILPDNIVVANVTPEDAERLYQVFVKRPLPQAPVSPDQFESSELGDLVVYPNPYEAMVLICSHRKRDKRCGITAPYLNREFDHVLRELDIPDGEGGTAVFMVSHIGGHKFAGNVIVYINQGRTGIWYGRVKTCDCRTIVEETIINRRVIKELYRGSMNHSFGPVEQTKCKRIQW